MTSKDTTPVAPAVVVGVDGSHGAEHALAWAVAKSDVLGPVTPVSTFQLPIAFDIVTRPVTGTDLSLYRQGAEAQIAKAVAGYGPELEERARVLESHPGVGLVRASANAELLVVGTRGRSGLAAVLLGSVSSYCVSHATVPVVVVPSDAPTDRPLRHAVVGVDGSENAEAALAWAVDHLPPDGKVTAVGCFSVWSYYANGVPDPPVHELTRRVEEEVRASVGRVLEGRDEHPEIGIRIEASDARVALPKLAADSDLLVVGARGVTGLAHLMLGSVASTIAHHPTVATVIVPAENRPADQY